MMNPKVVIPVIITLLAGLVTLALWTEYRVTTIAGQVESKSRLASTTTVIMQSCGQGCTMPSVIVIPECNQLVIAEEDTGKMRRICVSRETWGSLEVGSRFEGSNYEKDPR